MVENIVFDLGNVLISFKPQEWLAREFDEVDGDFLYEKFCLSPLWVDLDLGTRSLEEVEAILCSNFPWKKDIIKRFIAEYFDMLTPIPEGTALLKEFVKQGYPVYYLSNYHEKAFHYVRESFPWFHYFRGGICSSHYGLIKPDPAIYRRLCHDWSLDPEKTLFLDDTPDNVEAAARLGFHTILVEDPARLNRQVWMKLQ